MKAFSEAISRLVAWYAGADVDGIRYQNPLCAVAHREMELAESDKSHCAFCPYVVYEGSLCFEYHKISACRLMANQRDRPAEWSGQMLALLKSWEERCGC